MTYVGGRTSLNQTLTAGAVGEIGIVITWGEWVDPVASTTRRISDVTNADLWKLEADVLNVFVP